MPETKYDNPRLALNRIYTRRGDGGETSLVNGRRVPKDDLKIESFGTVDELNSFVGLARATALELAERTPSVGRLAASLLRVQHELFNLGSVLATDPAEVGPKRPQVSAEDVARLEGEIDEMRADLPVLRSFVLAGGCRINAELHVCRTVCRRAERICVALGRKEEIPPQAPRYLNRLSDALFVWSRWVCSELGVAEVEWEPNKAASGSG